MIYLILAVTSSMLVSVIMRVSEKHMKRIRPFIGTELIKAMIGIHCCGKSVMLELIERKLTEFGVSPTQFVSINFEDKNLIP